jgi:hypothetical protein
MSGKRVLTEDQRDQVASRYRKGETIVELAEAFKVSTAPILTALRELNVRIRSPAESRKLGNARAQVAEAGRQIRTIKSSMRGWGIS